MQCQCDRYEVGALADSPTLCMGPAQNDKHVCYPTPCVNTTRCNTPDLDGGEIAAIVSGVLFILMFIGMCILESIRQAYYVEDPRDPQDLQVPQVPQVPVDAQDPQDPQDLQVLELPQASVVMVAERR